MRSSAILLTLLAIVWACMSPDTASAGPTSIFNNITSNQTWTPAGSPYTISGPVTISADRTLTVESGTEVKIINAAVLTVDGNLVSQSGTTFKFGTTADKVKSSIDVYGTLIAAGTSGNKIYFVSDSVTPVSGDWQGININNTANVSFDNCVLRHGFYNISSQSGGSTIHIQNSIISNSYLDGIFVGGYGPTTSLTILNSIISSNGVATGSHGIFVDWNDGPVTITGNRISNNGDAGIRTGGPLANMVVTSNIITDNNSGIKSSTSNGYPASVTIGGTTADLANYIFQNKSLGINNYRAYIDPDFPTLSDPYVNITATHNWWGSPTGPKHSTNPGGTGDAVSDHVTFSPFYSGPAASLAPSSIDFGSVPVGSTASPQSIIVTNSGDLPLLLGAVALGGADSSAMTLALDTCSNITLAKDASCSVDVIFSPGTSRAYTARIDFPASATTIPVTYTATIAGTGTTAPVSLTIGFLGTGGGTVTFNSVNYYNDATVLATNGAGVEFIAAPDQYSLFSGWGGSCAGAGVCIFTTPGTTGGVTATFTRKSNPVKIEPALLFYSSITGPGGAYEGAAAAGSIIKTWGTNYTEALLFDLDKSVTLDGGYDSAFGTNTGTMTTVRGTMTVKCLMVNTVETCGSVSTRNLTIRQYP